MEWGKSVFWIFPIFEVSKKKKQNLYEWLCKFCSIWIKWQITCDHSEVPKKPPVPGPFWGRGQEGWSEKDTPCWWSGEGGQPVPLAEPGVPPPSLSHGSCQVPLPLALFPLSSPVDKGEPRASVSLTPGSLCCRVINRASRPGPEDAPRTGAVLLVTPLHSQCAVGPREAPRQKPPTLRTWRPTCSRVILLALFFVCVWFFLNFLFLIRSIHKWWNLGERGWVPPWPQGGWAEAGLAFPMGIRRCEVWRVDQVRGRVREAR